MRTAEDILLAGTVGLPGTDWRTVACSEKLLASAANFLTCAAGVRFTGSLFHFCIAFTPKWDTVVERLACLPPTKANRVQSPAGSPDVGIVPDEAVARQIGALRIEAMAHLMRLRVSPLSLHALLGFGRGKYLQLIAITVLAYLGIISGRKHEGNLSQPQERTALERCLPSWKRRCSAESSCASAVQGEMRCVSRRVSEGTHASVRALVRD
ncbi:hypothetical protein PR048_026006 [Dryococelus australis]|uniref:Uncharacterized protein n=1 Tax=Dryococelus australis TaxID=614101 RepID=A0ABQ9GK53_9NEOP|nr:hypothetical protein PR048_026006 [Dryococelus australis]